MRTLFAYIRHKVETVLDPMTKSNSKLSWQAISSFLFLRYLCPAMLNPHLYEIWPGMWYNIQERFVVILTTMLGMIEEPVKRTLTEIAKVIQNMGNFTTVCS